MTQHQLARVVGVAGGERISRWELGSSTPRPRMLHRLAEALHLDPADLVVAGETRGLRPLRLAAGLSAREVAALAHVSEPTYRRWENGRAIRTPAQGTLEMLARALQVSVMDVEREMAHARVPLSDV
jgi:transcriptional regulator with XRE-family HTH domain